MTPKIAELLDALSEQRANSVNAVTMTLVVFVDDELVRQWIRERAHEIGERHPARVIVLDTRAVRDAADVVIEDVALGELSIARLEFLEVGVAGASPDALASIVQDLSVLGMPVVLMWTSERLRGDPRFAALRALATTAIVDSSRLRSDSRTLEDVVDVLFHTGDRQLHDLAYLRIEPWQEMIAHFFDNAGFAIDLARVERIDVTAGSSAEAYYLLGWLAGRLDWHPTEDGALCAADGEPIPVSIMLEGESRRIRGITLHAAGSIYRAHLLSDDPHAVQLEVAGRRACERRIAPLGNADTPTLIERAMSERSTSALFIESARVARDLLVVWGSRV